MLTVKEYSQKAGVSPAFVRSQARSGKIQARKVGRDWLILDEPTTAEKQAGRLLSLTSFNELAAFLAYSPQALSPNSKRRAKERANKLRQEKIDWVKKHQSLDGVSVKYYRATPEVLLALRDEPLLEATGIQSESTSVFGDFIHSFVAQHDLRKIELVYSLKPVPAVQANIILRVVEKVPPLHPLHHIVSLYSEHDPRSQSEAERLLDRVLAEGQK